MGCQLGVRALGSPRIGAYNRSNPSRRRSHMIWALLFVIGVVLQAIAVNGGPPWFTRIAWILWAIAAVIWFAQGYGGGIPTHCSTRLIGC